MLIRRQNTLVRNAVVMGLRSGCRSLQSHQLPGCVAAFVDSTRRRGLSGLAGNPVGFVGLGNMGSCMARSLVRAGHEVVLYDVNHSKAVELAAETGATATSSLQELAQTSSSIITMLPNTPEVEAVYLGNPARPLHEKLDEAAPSTTVEAVAAPEEHAEEGEVQAGGVLDWVRPGTLVVDSSTIDPLASKRVNSVATSKGAIMLDAPVSGGVPAAANSSLTFIVGGTKEGVELARPLLLSMGSQVLHCGEAGTGSIAKVCNNLCLAVSMVGVSEAMSLGSKMGIDPKVLASVLNASTARCWSSVDYNPCPGVMENVPSSRGFQGGFAASLMEKDLHLALQAARESSQSLPMGALAHQLYSLQCNQGNAKKDFSGIYELISAGSRDGGSTSGGRGGRS